MTQPFQKWTVLLHDKRVPIDESLGQVLRELPASLT